MKTRLAAKVLKRWWRYPASVVRKAHRRLERADRDGRLWPLLADSPVNATVWMTWTK